MTLNWQKGRRWRVRSEPAREELCNECWWLAVERFKADPPGKTRSQHYREVKKEMGSHDDGHPDPDLDEVSQVYLEMVWSGNMTEGDAVVAYAMITALTRRSIPTKKLMTQLAKQLLLPGQLPQFEEDVKAIITRMQGRRRDGGV